MKFVLVLSLFLLACSSEKEEENHPIDGQWEWVQTQVGLSGNQETTANSGLTETFYFDTKKMIYTQTTTRITSTDTSKQVYTEKIHFYQENSILLNPNFKYLRYDTIYFYSFGDTILFTDNRFYGNSFVYKKVK